MNYFVGQGVSCSRLTGKSDIDMYVCTCVRVCVYTCVCVLVHFDDFWDVGVDQGQLLAVEDI